LNFNGKIWFTSCFVPFTVPQDLRFFFVRISWLLLSFFGLILAHGGFFFIGFCSTCVVLHGLGPLAAGRFRSWRPASIFYRTTSSFHPQLLVFISCMPGQPPESVSHSSFITAGFPSPQFLSVRSSVSFADSLSCGRWRPRLSATEVFATEILGFLLPALPDFVSLPPVCC
jgi:hypothetical protein